MAENADWLVEFFRAQARLGFEEGDYTRTRNSCERVIRQQPGDVEAWSMLGEAALASQDTASAVRCYEHLLELDPREDYAVQLAKAYIQMKAWDAAAAALQQALQLSPQHAPAQQMLELVERMRATLAALDQAPASSIGRNDPCPCGSGLKYKKCCLPKATGGLWREQLLEAQHAQDWSRVLAVLLESQTVTAETRRAEALARYELGERAAARPLVEACLADPGGSADAELLARYADLLLDEPNLAKAEARALQAKALDAGNWRAWLVIAVCQIRRNELDAAEATLRELVARVPDCQLGWERLGDLLSKQQRGHEALATLEQWVRLDPKNAQAWFRLGFVKILLGIEAHLAQPCFERALALDAEHHRALCWLGQCRRMAGQVVEAQQLMLHGLQLQPDYGEGWNLLGNLYQSLGMQHEAEGCFMRAVAITPENPFPWNNLANIYLDASELAEAESVMRQALRLNGDISSIWSNLGNILSASQRLTEGMDCYRKALELDPSAIDARANYGIALANFVRLDESIEALEPLSALNEKARSNLLFAANYHPDWPIERIYELYRRQVENNFPARRYFDYANDRTPQRKLRIGYVSPDFRMHSCRLFTEPLLANHDRRHFEVFVYSEVRREDRITERFKTYVDCWQRSVGVADELLAEQIRADGIDILIDLAGHTANNRLPVFALKPAPVQVTWLGFGYTTGLTSMDYYLTDEETVPPGYESVFSETPWRLRCPSFAYQAPDGVPEVTALPARRNGYVTFGTLTRTIRLNYKVIRTWAAILQRVPNSRLMLNSGAFLDAGLCDHFAAEFAQYGIARERLDMGCTTPPWPVLSSMDIALDCFPHNSGTTLFESMWMGLPYITLRDRPSMGRLGATILRGLGRDEWIANSEAEYIDKAVALASDLDALEQIRAGLRPAMQASPLCDGADFAMRVEEAYRGMWQRYCEQGEQR